MLSSLEEQLQNADMESMQTMAELQQQFGDALGEQLGPLEAAMAELDFDRAMPLCGLLAASRTP
jgi:hypothetical protein